ncbi:cytochrome P450 [Pseudosporangium ferrugineum]|uniref:Cytochrome P450 n=1 Tax=Pseudosporangium ferrugineum TaxID=439699 RepID=A0A2T0S122_9ACTN|nr:cytochrome P450 [Pseudosporangium ferrugineum]PRY27124.1 cytochrome P450 [Pseudosporangium ferrugineum]
MSLSVRTLGGPRPLPLVGNLPELTRGNRLHRVLTDWADTYGPTYRFRMGRTDVVGTADPAHLDVALRRRPDDFRRARRMAEVLEELAPHGVFTAEGKQWRRLRHVATQSLNAAYLRQYFATITRVTERLLGRWEAAAAAGARVDVLDSMLRFTLDVTAGLAMGVDLNALEDDGTGLPSRMATLFPAIADRLFAPFPYWRYAKLPRDRRLAETLDEFAAVVREHFALARDRVNLGRPPSNFLEALVRPLENEPELTDEEVVSNMLTMLVAGEDTTSSLIAWSLHFVAENPDVQERLRAEADEVLGSRRTPDDPPMVGRLKYAAAVVQEAQRMCPVAPYLIVEPTRDLTLTGQDRRELFLPAGQQIFLLNTYGALRDVERFPDPYAFRPQRWLDAEPTAETFPFAPFGGGPRFCPGRNLALLEAGVVVSVLAREMELVPDRSSGPVGEKAAFTVFPTNLFLRPRSRETRPARG